MVRDEVFNAQVAARVALRLLEWQAFAAELEACRLERERDAAYLVEGNAAAKGDVAALEKAATDYLVLCKQLETARSAADEVQRKLKAERGML